MATGQFQPSVSVASQTRQVMGDFLSHARRRCALCLGDYGIVKQIETNRQGGRRPATSDDPTAPLVTLACMEKRCRENISLLLILLHTYVHLSLRTSEQGCSLVTELGKKVSAKTDITNTAGPLVGLTLPLMRRSSLMAYL